MKTEPKNTTMGEGAANRPPRAAIYARYAEVPNPASLRRQLKACLDFVAGSGLDLRDVYVDASRTPPVRRPQLERLLADVRCGRLDVLVVENMDRLARDEVTVAHLTSTLKQNAVDIRDADRNPTAGTFGWSAEKGRPLGKRGSAAIGKVFGLSHAGHSPSAVAALLNERNARKRGHTQGSGNTTPAVSRRKSVPKS